MVPLSSPQEELRDLLGRSRRECKPDYGPPFAQAEEMCIENGLQEGHRAHDQKEGNGEADSILHPFIREDTDLEE